MDLLCCESTTVSVAKRDPALLLDDRVFEHMLQYETRFLPKANYLVEVQTDFNSKQRKILVDWMWEVCEEQRCQEDVFPLAVSYLDRFLSITKVHTRHLQMLGTTCLLLSSKLRESDALTLTVLVSYTDNSVAPGNVMMFELLLLTSLKWDMSTITAHDFLWYILKRLQVGSEERGVLTVVSHARTFVGMCVRDVAFIGYLPSIVAGASIAAALNGLEAGAIEHYDLYEKLYSILRCNMALLKQCQAKIENTVEQHRRRHHNIFGRFVRQQQRPAPGRAAAAAAAAAAATAAAAAAAAPASGGNDKTDNAPNGV